MPSEMYKLVDLENVFMATIGTNIGVYPGLLHSNDAIDKFRSIR